MDVIEFAVDPKIDVASAPRRRGAARRPSWSSRARTGVTVPAYQKKMFATSTATTNCPIS